MNVKIAIGSDHAGYKIKQKLIKQLKDMGYKVADMGAPSEEKVDYPDIAKPVCELVIEQEAKFGILICGTGIGMSIVANRYSDLRAALCFNADMSELARSHNDANILCIGAKVSKPKEIEKMVKIFLEQDFEGGRHIARLNKIN